MNGEGKTEEAEEVETDQVRDEKEIVSFCRKVNAGAGAFRDEFEMI